MTLLIKWIAVWLQFFVVSFIYFIYPLKIVSVLFFIIRSTFLVPNFVCCRYKLIINKLTSVSVNFKDATFWRPISSFMPFYSNNASIKKLYLIHFSIHNETFSGLRCFCRFLSASLQYAY